MVKKRTKKKPQRDGLIRFDPEKLDRLRLRNGWSKTMLANEADISRRTVVSVFQGKGIFASSANLIATAFGVSVEDLLPHKNDDDATDEVYALPPTQEWEPRNYLGGWKTASNGLQYRICRMRHRHIENRYGRGKFYDLLEVPTDDRACMREMLTRHAETSARIASHPHVATTLSAVPVIGEEGW